MNDDLEAGLPREQSEAAAIVEQSYAQHPPAQLHIRKLA